MKENMEHVKDIQNTLWKLYKEFLQDHDVRKYTEAAGKLVHKYDENRQMLLFCQNLVITWIPVINGMAEEFRREKM